MPKVSLKNQQVPFLLGGAGDITVETGELALTRPMADAPLLTTAFSGGGDGPFTLGRAESLRLAITARSAVELTPIVATSAPSARRLLETHGLGAFLESPGGVGRGVLCFRASAGASAAARTTFPYAALTTTVTLDTGADAAFAYLRSFDASHSVQKVLADFFREIRLPEQGNRAPDAGEAIALEFGGYVQIGAQVAAGYQLAGTPSVALGQLALSERYDLSIAGAVDVSARVAGRYRLLVTAADAPGWARVRVTRQASHELRCAADVKVSAANQLPLPGHAKEFLGAVLGVNGRSFVTLFNRALELTDFTAFRLATDGLARRFVEAVIGKSFDALSSKAEFERFLALVQRVVTSAQQVEDRAVALFDRYHDRLDLLQPFLERIRTLPADGLARLRQGLSTEQWTMLAQLTDGDPLAFLLDQVTVDGRLRDGHSTLVERAAAVLDLMHNRTHEDLRRVIATARQEFGIDRFLRDLASLDTVDELRAVANEKLGQFVTRLVGHSLESSKQLKEALKAIQRVLSDVDRFSESLFNAFKAASNSSYAMALHAEYSRASESDALVDVSINVAGPGGGELLRMAGRGDFETILTTLDADVVRLHEGVFTHRTRRHAGFHVNIVGWHTDYRYTGFDAVISESEQRLVPSEHGITVHTSASLTLQRERRRRDETVHVNFLLRALGESAKVVKSSPRDRDYVVDALTSLSARYELAFTDEDTSEDELRDYLAFAEELGLGPQGATIEHLAPLLPRTANRGFGAVTTSYDIRFGRRALEALLSVDHITPAAEKAIRQGLRLQVLANYLRSDVLHEVAFAYATPEVYERFRDEGAAQFSGWTQRAFVVHLGSAGIRPPQTVHLDAQKLNVLATLFGIENALVAAMKDLYKVLKGGAIDLAKFEKGLAKFGAAMRQFDEFDQTASDGAVGTNTVFVVFDRLVRLAAGGPSAAVAVLHVSSTVGDQTVEKRFMTDEAAASS